MLLHKDDFSGLWDKNKMPIYAGDKIKMTFSFGGEIVGTCRFNKDYAAYGLELPHGDGTEFYPFCQLCNVEYEVIESEATNNE